MPMEVTIKKDLGAFKLDIAFQSDSRRIGILGASGCGKSMTLKSIAGIEHPDGGRISVNGKVVFDSKQRISLKPQKRRIGYLFQNYALFPTMTVEQNIAAGLRGPKAQIRQQAARMIERFQLKGLEKRLPNQLSGGQQQRVALARILACEPEVILLDEPFSALDVYLRDQMQRELMRMLKDYPGIVIMVSHNRDEVYRMSQELLILDQGKLAGQGETKRVFANPTNVVTARLTGCKNIAAAKLWEDGLLHVEDWGLAFPLRDRGSQKIGAVAIRAHEFQIEREKENGYLCFPVLDPVVTEDLFEYNISFRTSEECSGRLDWKISKYIRDFQRNLLPDRLFLKEQDLLLLEDEA